MKSKSRGWCKIDSIDFHSWPWTELRHGVTFFTGTNIHLNFLWLENRILPTNLTSLLSLKLIIEMRRKFGGKLRSVWLTDAKSQQKRVWDTPWSDIFLCIFFRKLKYNLLECCENHWLLDGKFGYYILQWSSQIGSSNWKSSASPDLNTSYNILKFICPGPFVNSSSSKIFSQVVKALQSYWFL